MNIRASHLPSLPGPRCRGFSLLEILLAMLVFSIMAAAAYGALNAMSAAASAQERAAERLAEAQVALLRLERELRHTVSAGMFADPVTRPGLQGSPGFLAFEYLTAQTLEAGPEMRHLQYRFENATLYRVPSLLTASAPAPLDALAVLTGVTRLEFSFMDANGNWQSSWRAGSNGDLPAGVRLFLQLEGLGTIERWFELPGDRP